MQTQDKLYFIRHAQSKFNLAQMVAADSNSEVREGEDLGVKFDYGLIDCGISDLGKQQVCIIKSNSLLKLFSALKLPKSART